MQHPQSQGTRRRSLEVSSTTLLAHPPDLQSRPLMDMDFAVACPLVRPTLPRIRFLFVGSRFCSTLPSDSPSRFCPCASLHFTSIRLSGDFHPQVVEHARHTARFAPPPAMAWRPGLTAAARDACRNPGRDGETALGRTEKLLGPVPTANRYVTLSNRKSHHPAECEGECIRDEHDRADRGSTHSAVVIEPRARRNDQGGRSADLIRASGHPHRMQRPDT